MSSSTIEYIVIAGTVVEKTLFEFLVLFSLFMLGVVIGRRLLSRMLST